ncbi:hypothetical protein LCL87_02370 [Rhodococcus hoagii]|nr:hypothetical protein [Prescottella equi]
MKTVSSSGQEARVDSLLDHPTSGFVVVAGFVSGLVVFGVSVLGAIAV